MSQGLSLAVLSNIDVIAGLLRVAISGSEYNSIQSAIDAAETGDTIAIYPGVYTENIVLNKNIRIVGETSTQSIVIRGATSDPTLTITSTCTTATLKNITVVGPSTGSNYAIDCTSTVLNATFFLASIAVIGGGAGGGLKCSTLGNVLSVNGFHHNGGTFTLPLVLVDGGNFSAESINGGFGITPDVVKVTDGTAIISGIILLSDDYYQCDDVFDISGGSLVVSSTLMSDLEPPCTNCIHISGDGIILSISDVHAHSKTSGFNLLVDSGLTGAGTKILIQGEISSELISIPDAYQAGCFSYIVLMTDDASNNDVAYRLDTEVAIGSVNKPAEISIGEGDSVTNDMVIFSYNGATYTNNTTAAKSRSDSTFAGFGGTSNGSIFYLGHTARKFYGLKIDITTPLNPTGATVVSEYWNGSAWVAFNVMSTRATAPYTSYANNAITRLQSEHVRFDYTTMSADWATTTVNSQLAYWARYRITSGTLTTDVVVERVKLHTNRTEINKDGFVEYFGVSQPSRTLFSSHRYSLKGYVPADATIDFSSNVSLIYEHSSLVGSKLDGFGQTVIVPFGLDTSRSISVIIRWCVNDSSTGPIELKCTYVSGTQLGSNIHDSALTETIETEIITIDSDQTGILKETSFTFAIPTALVGDELIFQINRDARASNGNDTNSGNVYVYSVRYEGVFWS